MIPPLATVSLLNNGNNASLVRPTPMRQNVTTMDKPN